METNEMPSHPLRLLTMLLLCASPALAHPVPESPNWLTYPGGEGPGKNKHIVLISAEQEYRSEQSMPMLAKILSKHHGFDCTVLFAVNDKGEVDPTMPVYPQKGKELTPHHIPGTEHLASADLVIFFCRLLTLPMNEREDIVKYIDSGKPFIAIRTANHGFHAPLPYKIDGKDVNWGRDVLGGAFMEHSRTILHLFAALALCLSAAGAGFEVKPLTPEQASEYKLLPSFYKKATLVQGIFIATSERVPDVVHLEAAYQFESVMSSIKPEIAQRIRDQKVLCVLVGHGELTSDLPQFVSKKTGKELDFYNWRQRGFLTEVEGRRVVLFAEEDVLEYEGGMQLERILIHEFGHVVDGAGFNEEQHRRLTDARTRRVEGN